jgi:hypothetical protein
MTVRHAVGQLYREKWGHVLATLIRVLRDFDLAEEAAQESFAAALEQWPARGAPENPTAWLIQTGSHKATVNEQNVLHFRESPGDIGPLRELVEWAGAGSTATARCCIFFQTPPRAPSRDLRAKSHAT